MIYLDTKIFENMTSNLSIMTVNFNTPEFIFALYNSLKKQNSWFQGTFYVIDNSDIKVLSKFNSKEIEIYHFDNNLYHFLDILPKSKYKVAGNYNSARHAFTIDWGIKNIIKTDHLLLLDSDIILNKDIEFLYREFVANNYALMGYKRTTYEKFCIAPWFCFINVKMMRELDLNYFDQNRILYVNDNLKYDTGASLYEDFISHNKKIKEYNNDNEFYIHLKGGSVKQINKTDYLKKYSEFFSNKPIPLMSS